MLLGYDTYSLRAYGWKAFELLEFASRRQLNAIQFSSLSDFESLEPAYLIKVRDRARELNISIDAGTGCVCPSARAFNAKNGDAREQLTKAIVVARTLGARSLRCFLGEAADRTAQRPIEFHIEQIAKVFKSCRTQALDAGLKIALENHSGDLQAWELKALIEEAGRDYVAACFDAGNPIWCAEDPLTAMETLGPLIVTTHVRDTAIFEHPRGCAAMWTALGDGGVSFQRICEIRSRLCPTAALQLEIITGRPPRVIPYLESSFWEAYPKARAYDFAMFVALVKSGHPLMAPMVVEDAGGAKPPEYAAALKQQQLLDLERSINYARQFAA